MFEVDKLRSAKRTLEVKAKETAAAASRVGMDAEGVLRQAEEVGGWVLCVYINSLVCFFVCFCLFFVWTSLELGPLSPIAQALKTCPDGLPPIAQAS